ncbi:MAG: 2,3-bisphosphoglycerate-independent phosphoglycerate mutase [Candidatus Komeilibacteria bacterium]|nr:2,3-bisphosphoglycerate-independent phosphoglycerate mutase [Candidatus Komeilibacteria bacterium]
MAENIKNLPLVLLILDGWGIASPSRGNAFTGAKIPFYNDLIRNYQSFSVAAAGEAVGLPWGEPGNSEVGHLNLGAGRIVYQEVLRINKSIENNTFFDNEVLSAAVQHCKQHNSSLHLMGLVSDGGVHSHQDHLYALLELAARAGLRRVYVHVFLDGRDSAYNSGAQYVESLERIMKRLGVGRIATISGRFYAMDRDNNWDRLEPVYWAMVKGEAKSQHASAAEAIAESYKKGVYDEEFVPCVIKDSTSDGTARVQPGDSLIFFNYRPDRARQLTKAFVLPTFTKFTRTVISNLNFVTLTEYEPDLPVFPAFKKDIVEKPIGRVWSEAGLKQLRIAETEKYAHVTYFFNGGQDTVFAGQENMIVPSVGGASYADAPAMSVKAITAKVLGAIENATHQCLVVNFANADMVGHTGNLRATQAGLAEVDTCLKDIITAVLKKNGVVIITADHGNAEEMVNWETGHILKEHSASPVPCILIGEPFKFKTPKPEDFGLHSLKINGVLADVGVTALNIVGLAIPKEMTARPLL